MRGEFICMHKILEAHFYMFENTAKSLILQIDQKSYFSSEYRHLLCF